MKKQFSTSWKSSKQPRKQRKYLEKAPIHLKRKMLSVNLIKTLREKYGRRNIVVKKGDKVKIMRGKFKGKQGKVTEVKIKLNKIYVEGIQIKKRDGSKSNVRLQPSNLQIIELNLDDKKRLKERKSPTQGSPSAVASPKGKKETIKKAESKEKTKEKKE